MIVVSIRIRIIGIVIIRVGISIRIAVIIISTSIRGTSSQGNNQTQEEQITGLHRVYLTFSRSAQPLGKPWLTSAGSDVLAGALIMFSNNKNRHHYHYILRAKDITVLSILSKSRRALFQGFLQGNMPKDPYPQRRKLGKGARCRSFPRVIRRRALSCRWETCPARSGRCPASLPAPGRCRLRWCPSPR